MRSLTPLALLLAAAATTACTSPFESSDNPRVIASSVSQECTDDPGNTGGGYEDSERWPNQDNPGQCGGSR